MNEISYIALGSNMANPLQQVTNAIEKIAALPNTSVLARSSLYQTKPLDNMPQADYINAVIAVETQLSLPTLMTNLLEIEALQGRVRNGLRNQSRPLDLDILLYGDIVHQSELVTVPHYALKQRAFVLMPLHEIAPTLQLPDKMFVKDCLKNISLAGVIKL